MDGSSRVSFDPQSSDLPRFGMVGDSSEMYWLRRIIVKLAPINAPVHIMGESGTGKELIARALHDASPRATGPFVTLNAGALPATLIASTLYGHERGAFTGATQRHRGAFEQAHGGTLFIDEVAELPADLQAWLLRAVESGEVTPLGAERPRRFDVRIVTATHEDLEDAVICRRFRADLYFRLSVLLVNAPSLVERSGDIPALAAHFLEQFKVGEPRRLGPDALQALMLHRWPGNVRELRTVLLRAAAKSASVTLGASDIMGAIRPKLVRRDGDPTVEDVSSALAVSRGNVAAAARRLGIPRSTLRDRLRDGARPRVEN